MPCKHLIMSSPAGCTACVMPCGTPLYQEETEERGGAAVMRMILGSQKVGLSPLPSQQDLYADAVSRNRPGEGAGTWYIDPQGLRDSLIHFKPATFTNTFVNFNFASGDQAAANAKLVYTIDTYEVAPAVLVQGGTQWLAVVGYETDGAGALQTVFINNPDPPVGSGTGDPPDFGVSAALWNSNYLQLIDRGVFWRDQYAMVCDPDAPTGELVAAKERPRADGRRLITPDQAIAFSQQILEERGMLEHESFALGVRQGMPAKPQLVQVLDREDQFYYLVRYQIGAQDAAVVTLDARFGVFLEAIAYPRPVRFFRFSAEEIPRLLTQGLTLEERLEDVSDRIVNRLLQSVDLKLPGVLPGWDLERLRPMLEEELARARQPVRHREVRPEEVSVHPLMVWKPSALGVSTLSPFYQVNTPQQRIYMRPVEPFPEPTDPEPPTYPELPPIYYRRLGG